MRYTPNKTAYIAVIAVKSLMKDANGQVIPCIRHDYLGPYPNVGPAKARVTAERKSRGSTFCDGWVEECTGWKRLDADE